jgi:spore coat protein H
MLVTALTLAGALAAASPPAAPAPSPELFGLTRVLKVEFRLTPAAWERMQPAAPPQFGPGFPPGPGVPPFGPAPAGRPPNKTRGAHRTMMGMEYPLVRAAATMDGTEYPDIALRYKGNFTYMASSQGLKRPFRVDLGRYVKGRAIGGVSKFSLNNNITDPSHMREVLAYDLFRKARVPAPRTAFAQVYLTVPGRYDHQYLGLYTLVEAVDDSFLKAQFGSDNGLLLKPQFQGLPYLGEEWPAYAARFGEGVKGTAPPASTARFIALARLVNQADDNAFRQGIAGLLDVDEFLRFLAANALLVNLDSFLAMGQNYYLYHEPAKNRFSWIPWDLDLAFGAWPMGGSPEQQEDLSLLHPYGGQNPLIERVLKVPEYRSAYLGRIGELLRGPFSVQRLNAAVDAARPAIRSAIADEGDAALLAFERATGPGTAPATGAQAPGRPGEGFPLGMPSLPLRRFFQQRVQSASAQLAGKRSGYVIQPGSFGPGAGGPGMALGRPLFSDADRDRDGRVTPAELAGMLARWATEWDSDRSGALDGAELARGLNRLIGFPEGGVRPGNALRNDLVPGPGAPGGGPPPFGGPGAFLGAQLLRAGDPAGRGRLTAADLSALAREWSRTWDRDRDGVLTVEEFGAGLGALLGPPPGFGGLPRGAGPPAPDEPRPGGSR